MSAKRKFPGPSGTIFSEIDHIGVTGSTNADLLAQVRLGAQQGAVLVTDHQTAGRGRQQRTWHDEPGNSVLMSVLLNPSTMVAPLSPLIGGVAVVEALDQLGADLEDQANPEFGLKWPNDVLVSSRGEAKVAGILSEATTISTGTGPHELAVVLGMGLNLRWSQVPPSEVERRSVTLEAVLGRSVDRWDVVNRLLVSIDRAFRQADQVGPGPAMAEYRRRCLTIGRHVRFVTAAGEVEGVAKGIGEDGSLLIDSSDGLLSLVAGDAHHI